MTVLRIFTKNSDWRGAVDTLDALVCAGCEPDALALNTVLGICVGAGKVDVAERFVKDWHAQADTISCNTLLKGYAKKPSLEKAGALFSCMLTSGPAPNVISINTLLDYTVLALQQTSQAAVWSERTRSGTWSRAASQGQHVGMQRVLELLDQLDNLSIAPDRYICSTLVKGTHAEGCTEKDIDLAVALIKSR